MSGLAALLTSREEGAEPGGKTVDLPIKPLTRSCGSTDNLITDSRRQSKVPQQGVWAQPYRYGEE